MDSLETVSPTNVKNNLWTRLKSDGLLLMAAAVWGFAFVAQRSSANQVGVFWFNGTRFILGAMVLFPMIRFKLKLQRQSLPWIALAGSLIFSAGGLQQAGLMTTTAGNAGFLTGLYVVFVPVFLVFFLRKRLAWTAWSAATLALAGGWLLSAGGAVRFAFGDLLEILGAVLWAVHVIVVSRQVQRMDVLSFAVGQYLVCGVLNLSAGLLFEPHGAAGLLSNAWSVAYTGFISVGMGYTLQALGQRHAPPVDASIIMSMEAIFAALSGFLFLGESFTPAQMGGSALIVIAVLLSQLGNESSIMKTDRKGFWEAWKQRAHQLKLETYTLYLAYRDPRTPWYAKGFLALVIGYAFSPIDLIPDFIPILGYLDDLVLVPLGVALALKMIPAEVYQESKIAAAKSLQDGKPVSWVAAVIIGCIWALVLGLVVYFAWQTWRQRSGG